MSMLGGVNVIVADDESTSAGSGLKLELYNADKATLELETLPALGATAAPYSTARPVAQADIDIVKAGRVRLLRDAARRANAYGGTIVTHIIVNGKAKVTTGDAGIQRMPASTTENTECKAPAGDKFLALV